MKKNKKAADSKQVAKLFSPLDGEDYMIKWGLKFSNDKVGKGFILAWKKPNPEISPKKCGIRNLRSEI